MDCSLYRGEDLQSILREAIEIAVATFKKEKTARVDNIPAELSQAGGETMTDVLTKICQRFGKQKNGLPMDSVADYYTPEKGNLQLCQNYRTISLINHPSKVMLKVLLNRLKPQAEEIIAEEQAGFRAEKAPQNTSSSSESCVKSTFNMSSQISKKHLTGYGMQSYGPPCGSTISM